MGSSALRSRRSRSLRSGALAGLVGLLLLVAVAPQAHAAACSETFSDDLGFRWDVKSGSLGAGWASASAGGFIDDGGVAALPPGGSLPGQSEAYDGWGPLEVDNTGVGAPGSSAFYLPVGNLSTVCDHDADSGNRELTFPGETIESLTVSRKLFTPASGGFVRFLDVVTNPGGSPATVTLTYQGDLGSDAATRVRDTSDGNSSVNVPGDRWGTSDSDPAVIDPVTGAPQTDPPVAHVWDGPGSPPEPTDAIYGGSSGTLNWGNDVTGHADARVRVVYNATIPAGQTYVFMHFEAQRTNATQALTAAQNLGNALVPDGFASMSESELGALVNWNPTDLDGDGVGPGDNCRFVANANQLNTDGDSTGNACDDDDDNDGLSDATEAALGTNPLSSDSDGDGKPDASDSCPLVAGTSASGCPVAPPPPPGAQDTTPPRVTVIVQSKVKLKSFKRGLTAAARVNEPASIKFELLGAPPARKRARTRAKAFTRVLARQSLAMAGAGLRAARLRPAKKLLGKARKFVVQLRVTAIDRAGNRTVVTRRINVR
jgi:hypothetical protein